MRQYIITVPALDGLYRVNTEMNKEGGGKFTIINTNSILIEEAIKTLLNQIVTTHPIQ